MKNEVNSILQSVQLGEPQFYSNIAIVPVIASADGTFQYHTLSEALARSDIMITEVSAAGAVPELTVVNRGSIPVLLIDGEELAGAKQNRVLNTSILVRETRETKIPVSCTEARRWHYHSPLFTESGNVMAYKSRARKTRSVHESLLFCGAPKSNQSQVWSDIASLESKASMPPSPTCAMSDIYKAREEELRQCDEIFTPVANQVGLVAFIGGKLAGADMVSLASAYARLHPKLVRSYTLEGLVESNAYAIALDGVTDRVQEFLAQIEKAEERQFPSVGYGTDCRYKSKGLAGTALVHENEVIHAAFFQLDEPSTPSPRPSTDLAPFWSRRRHHE